MRRIAFLAYVRSMLKRLIHALIGTQKINAPRAPVAEQHWTDEQRKIVETFLQDKFLMEEFFNAMDHETSRICEWQLRDHTMKEIAEELNLTVDSLSDRYMNGLHRAVEKLLERHQGEGRYTIL